MGAREAWEYLVLSFDTDHTPERRWRTNEGRDLGGEGCLVEALNTLGQDGWEAYSAQGLQNIACVALKRRFGASPFEACGFTPTEKRGPGRPRKNS